jgi:transposase
MFYGVDLHMESFKVAALGEGSEDIQVKTVSLQSSAFAQFKNNLSKDDYVVVEASTNTFWFIEQIRERVREVFVVDPFKFSIIANSRKKTDKIDAIKLVKKLKYYVCFDQSADEFPIIYIPCKEVVELRSMFVTYEQLKKQTCMTKNRIRSLLRQNAIFDLAGKNLSYHKVQEELQSLQVRSALRVQLDILLVTLQLQEQQKGAIKTEILKAGRIFHREIRILTSIRGISPFLAIAIMTDIVDINRFPNAKKLCSYLRAAPRIDASGNTAHIGKINKQSRTLTASLMTESIKHFIDSSDRLYNFYFKKRIGKSAGKVRVAVMRKVIVIIYNMLKRNTLYYYTDAKNHAAKVKQYNAVVSAA